MSFNQKKNFLTKIFEPMNWSKNFDIDLKLSKRKNEILSQLKETNSKKIALFSSLGKSTTADFIRQIFNETESYASVNLDEEGQKIFPLRAYALSFKQRWNTDYYLTILNESELIDYFNDINFDYLILNNFFGSHANVNENKKLIKEAIKINPDITLIINADEPNFYDIDKENKVKKIYFGINNADFVKNSEEITGENDLKCPICYLSELNFEKRYYSHIGKYACRCGFKRPKLDISADVKVFGDYCLMSVYYKSDKFVYKIPLGGVHNAYDALSAIALCTVEGVKRRQITNALEEYQYLCARDEIKNIKNKKIKIKLAKDEISFTQAIRELYHQKNRNVVIYLSQNSDNWLEEASFEALKNNDIKIFIISEHDETLKIFNEKEISCNQNMSSFKNVMPYIFKEDEEENILIITEEILVKEIYKNLDNICNN